MQTEELASNGLGEKLISHMTQMLGPLFGLLAGLIVGLIGESGYGLVIGTAIGLVIMFVIRSAGPSLVLGFGLIHFQALAMAAVVAFVLVYVTFIFIQPFLVEMGNQVTRVIRLL